MRSMSLALFRILAVFSACARATPIPEGKPAVSASTGNGGMAQGGSVYGSAAGPSLVSAFSGNAGNADASSYGDALASDSSRTNSAGSSDRLGSPLGGGLVNIITALGDKQRIGSSDSIL